MINFKGLTKSFTRSSTATSYLALIDHLFYICKVRLSFRSRYYLNALTYKESNLSILHLSTRSIKFTINTILYKMHQLGVDLLRLFVVAVHKFNLSVQENKSFDKCSNAIGRFVDELLITGGTIQLVFIPTDTRYFNRKSGLTSARKILSVRLLNDN